MIVGQVTPYREAAVSLKLTGPGDVQSTFDAVIDTGFTDYLTVPAAIITELSLPARGALKAELADGSEVEMDTYAADVEWNGTPRRIIVLAAEGSPLIGMSLLYGHELTIQVVDGGPVTITPLPAG
jgi:clan AA aspartic protease